MRPAGALRGYAFVLGAASIWATIGPVYQVLIDEYGMTPAQVATVRAAAGFVLVFCALLLFKARALHVAAGDVPLLLAFGLIGIAGFYTAYIWSVHLVGVSLAVTLLYTSPVWVALLSWSAFGEKPGRRQTLALAAALLGCMLVAQAYDYSQLRLNLAGVLAGLVSGITYAGYTVLGRMALARYDPWTVVVWSVGIGAAALGLIAGVLEPVRAPPAGAWPLLLYLGVGPTVGGLALYLLSLRRLPGSVASVVATMEPVIAVAIGVGFLGERLAVPQVLGGTLILAAVLLLQMGKAGS